MILLNHETMHHMLGTDMNIRILTLTSKAVLLDCILVSGSHSY